jgi:hypothetical protein
MKAKACTTTAPRFWALLVESKAPMNPMLKTMSEAKPTTLPRLQRHFEEKRHA